jgi:molecular chaperone Hsp33
LRAARNAAPTQTLDPAPDRNKDTLWRALTRGGEARLLVARTSTAARQAAERVDGTPDVTRLVAELATGALLLRSTLNPDEQLQLYVAGDGTAGRVVAEAWDAGGVRVYVQRPSAVEETPGALLGAGTLEVARKGGRLAKSYHSAVALAGGRVDATLMHYLLESEQILGVLKLEHALEGARVRAAGGALMQMMPEGTREDLARMVENLETVGPLLEAMSPEDPDGRGFGERAFAGFRWDQCAREPVRYACRCSEERIVGLFATLSRAEIEEMATGAEPIEVQCDFCRTPYRVAPARLRELLRPPSEA